MARIQKKSPKLNLSRYQTLIVDTKDNSEYFRLSEVPDTLTSGKNGFLIEGSTFLKPTTEIKIEVLDVDGNTLFVQPGEGIPEYYEGLSKLISIYVYQDTPIGIGKITILGEAESYIDENGLIKPVPEEWTGIYNVKWEKEIKINKNLLNESKVRFVKRPEVIIEELGESFYSKTISTETQTTGTVKGIAVTPSIGTDLRNYAGGVIYYIKNESIPFEDGAKDISIVGTQIQSASIVEYVNQYTLLVRVPHTSSEYIVGEFSNANYGLNYQYISSIAESALFGSFARFEINNLATFVGDVERVKLYGKSNAVSADYNLLYDARIDSQNLLETIVSGSIIDRGFFSASYDDIRTWNTYWTTESLAGSGQILLDTNNLYKSVKFRNYKVKSNVGDDIRLEKGSEYTLEFYVYYNVPSQSFLSNTNDKLKVYASSGLRQGNGLTPNYYFTTSLDTLSGDNKWRTPVKISYNFIPNVTDDWSINFEAINEDTVLGDTFWQVGSVKIYGSNELGYSPDEFGFTLPIQRQIEQETFDFRLEYYDLNNNFVPIQNTTSKTFVSGNLTLLGKNLSVDADKLFFTFEENSLALPDPQEISINAYKTRLVGNILITSQAFDSGGAYIPPATFLGTPYPGNLVNRYEDLTLFTGSLKIADFTGSLHGVPPGPGNVIVDKILYTFTEAGSSQPQVRRLSISRVLTNSGTGSVGSAGADAKTVNLTSNIYAIPYGSDGIEIGTNNIFLTASQQNHEGIVYYEFLQDGVTKQNTTSEYYTVINAEKPNTGSRNSWRVNTREGSSGGTIVAFDTIDLFGLKDGVNGWTVFLTNGATTFPASDQGIVASTDLLSGISDVVFFRGTSSFTYDQTSPYDINSYRTGSITSSTNINFSTSVINNQLRITPTSINTNGGVDLTGSIIIPLIDNYANVTFRPVYTFSVSKAGVSGSNAISIVYKPQSQVVSKNTNGVYGTPTTFSIQLFETGSPLVYTGSSATLQNSHFTIYLESVNGILVPATGSLSASIIPPNVVSDNGVTSSFAIKYKDSAGRESGFISQSYFVYVVNDGINGASGSDARVVSLTSDKYVFTYNGSNILTPLNSQTASLTASAQTGSKSWGGNIFYEFLKNGITKVNSTNPYYIITGSEIPSAGNRDLWQVNLRSGSLGGTVVAFDNIDIFGLKDGGDAKTVTLNSPYYIISYNADNTLLSPSTLFKVTASAQNFTIPYFRFTGDIDTVEGAYTIGSSSYEDTASFTPPSTYFSTPKSIRVGVAESSSPTVEVAYDTITIAAVKPGSNGINGLASELYYIKPISGTQIRNSQGTLEIQAIYVSGNVSYNLQSGSIQLTTGSSAKSVLQVGSGVTAGTNGVAYNAIFNSAGISGSRTIILKDTGSNTIYDTITLLDVTDGLGGGSALVDTLIFRRDSGSSTYTPSTGSLTASFFGTNDTEYQERYRVYPYFEGGIDKMYFTLDTDSSNITASVDNGDGIKLGQGFVNRNSTKDINFTFEFRDPQVNSTASFVETLYIISDGGDGEDAYTVLLTNESHNLATDNTGIVDYNGSGTSIIAYKGTTELNGITSGNPINGQFSASFEVVSGSISVGTITSPGNPIIVGNHSNMTTTSSLIRFNINLEGSASFVKLQSLAKAIEGDDGYTIFLTNEAHTFPADENGNVTSANLTAGKTDIRFFRGTTQYIHDQTIPYATNTYRTGSVTASFNITASQTIINNDVTFTPTSVTGSTQLSGSIIIPVIDNATDISFTKTYTFSISKAGTSGSNSLSIILNPSNQTVTKSQAGAYQRPVTFSVQVFETGSPLLYTGSNNILQSGYFTIFAPSAAGTLVPATGSISASIIPSLITNDSGVSSSFSVVYRDSKGTLSTHISQSHRVSVVSDGINGSSGSDAFAVNLISNRYTFTYDQNGTLTPLTSQTASLTASAQTGSAAKPWGANIFYEWIRNGIAISPTNYTSPFWIITGSTGPSPIPSPGGVDVYQVNLRSGSSQALVAFDNVDLFGLKSGSDGYTVFLTNEAHTFPADEQGNVNVSSLSTGITDIRFFRGATQYTYNQTGTTGTYRTGSVTASFNITASQTIVNNDVRFTPTNVTGSTGQLSGSIIIPVIDNATNVSFTKNYTFSITKAGTSGSNAIDWWMTPSAQSVTASLLLGTYSTASRFNVYVFETGSPMRYTTSDPPTTKGTWTIVMSSIGSNGTNNSLANEISGTITPPLVTAIRPFTSSFQIRYLDSKGNLSNYISQSHVINVVSLGQTGPGVVFTGPWSESRTYQYSEGSANGRRDVIYETSSGVYYAALQQHLATGANKPPNASFWQSLGTEDYFVAAKIAIFEESYVQNNLNVGTNNYESGFSAANITLAGGTPNPYISIGQSSQGYGLSGIWIGNTLSKPSASFVNATGDRYLKWDSNTLDIRGIITASAGFISGTFTVGETNGIVLDGRPVSRSIYIGAGRWDDTNTGFFVSASGDFSLGNAVSWNNSISQFRIRSGTIEIGATNRTTINSSGQFYTNNADISGRIISTNGTIGGWEIETNKLSAATNAGSIELNTGTNPAIKIYSGSANKLSVNINAAGNLSNTSSVTLNTNPSTITTSQLRGSSNNNNGTNISSQYSSNVSATYISGSTTRLTGSSAIIFDVSASNNNSVVTINLGTISANGSNSASFKATVDSAYYISNTNFTMRYGFALYSASSFGGSADVFVDSVSKNGTGTNTFNASSSPTQINSNISYTGSLVLSRTLTQGTYHIIPFVDNISISATATEVPAEGCGCPSYGTFAYYGNCVGNSQEVYRYTGNCTEGVCDVYLSYEGNCL